TTTLGNAAYYMYTRESQNFTLALDNLDLEIELVGITPGLAVGDSAGNVLMDEVGDTAPIFDNAGNFTPTFYTAADAPPGVYSASFQLNDNSGTYMSGGTFHFDFSVIPEPSSLVLSAFATIPVCGIRRR
ncbi:MAG: all3515 family Zur-repressed PEP-CTERM protein, partial [Lacipirellulaceae bacterium]